MANDTTASREKQRDTIKAKELIRALQDHALGLSGCELKDSQVRAAEILLRKILPDISAAKIDVGTDVVQFFFEGAGERPAPAPTPPQE